MKTKELIEVLQKADPEQEIMFLMDDGCCGDTLDLEINFFDVAQSCIPGYSIFFRILFNSVPGYRSCIQSSNTKRAHEEYWKDKPSSNPPPDEL